jgi:hypothetical protein
MAAKWLTKADNFSGRSIQRLIRPAHATIGSICRKVKGAAKLAQDCRDRRAGA